MQNDDGKGDSGKRDGAKRLDKRAYFQALFGYPIAGMILAFLIRFLRNGHLEEKWIWDLGLAVFPTVFLVLGLVSALKKISED